MFHVEQIPGKIYIPAEHEERSEVPPALKKNMEQDLFSERRDSLTPLHDCIYHMFYDKMHKIQPHKEHVIMSHVLAVVNQKGGVGKTTTTVNLATLLAVKGKKVLVIDADPQGNATSGLGFDKNKQEKTLYDVLINNEPIRNALFPTGRENLFLVPANIQLAGAEIELVNLVSRETFLKRALKEQREQYDFVLMDCPPSLGLLTVNALTAADGVLVPIQSEYYALEGLTQLLETVTLVKRGLNPQLSVFGVVVTMFDARTQLAHQVANEVRRYFGEKVFRTIIPRNVRLSEAPSFGKSINEYDPRSKGAESYDALSREVIRRAGGYV
jgi:chromosome partitioning protein